MKLSDFLYNLDEFYVRSQEQNLPATVSKEWDILYNKYQDFNEPFLEPANPNARDNGALADLMREILIFVLDNFRYFNYCFAYDIEQRRAICPRLTVANYDVILGKLIQDYIIFEEKPDFTEEAESKLDAIFKRVVSGGADWSATAWIVNFVSDELGYYIVDNEDSTYEFVKRTWNEETENWEFTDVLNVAYFAEEIDDLINAVNNYTDFEDGVFDADEVPVEIVNIVFDKDATIAKADGDTILVATLSNDDELTFYVDNSGEIAFIEENGVDVDDRYEDFLALYDDEITTFYNNNIDEILNTFDVMNTGQTEKADTEKVIDVLSEELSPYGVSPYLLTETYYDSYGIEPISENSIIIRMTTYPGNTLATEIRNALSIIGIKPLSIKRGSSGGTGRRAEYHEYFVEIDFNNPEAKNLPKAEKQLKIKYVAIDKSTYATAKDGIEFAVEINGVKATGIWRPYSIYTKEGVDVNELKIGNSNVEIFSTGGGYRMFEIHGVPTMKEKQPKDLRFTGEYYDTTNLGEIFKKKILDTLAGKLPKATLSDKFLKAFKIIDNDSVTGPKK